LTTAPKATQAPCRHHWIIPSSREATVTGVCKLCGEEKKEMQNQWGFYSSAREAISDWQVQEHLKRVEEETGTGGGGLTPI